MITLVCALFAAWQPPDAPEIIALAVVESMIVVDVLQTADAARHGWRNQRENNPLLGPYPTETRVFVMGAVGALATAGVWLALPPRWRLLVPLIVGIGEAAAIGGNIGLGLTVRFP
jgi:hypothetical protein